MENFSKKYCIDVNNYERFPSKTVKIGNLKIGGLNPVLVQSMTNVAISNIDASVNQCKTLFDAGADLVRLAVPRIVDVDNLQQIKDLLHKDGYKKPLIADVHFDSKIAIEAARVVEKVRINPGNYIPDHLFKNEKLTDNEYQLELELIHEKILPLIRVCKQYGTALRIGSNHGSLSKRILARYGNTIEGMVEAVMEFLEVFVYERFFNIVVSMKASDTATMIYASRLLNARMIETANVFPMHLGVTEAGEGFIGRMKSAVGIGSLLGDGIGDTIRVSLSEASENELIFAKKIVSEYSGRTFKYQNISQHAPTYNPFEKSHKYPKNPFFDKNFLIISENLDTQADLYYISSKDDTIIDTTKKYIAYYKTWKSFDCAENIFPMLYFADTQVLKIQNDVNYFVLFERSDLYKAETLTLLKMKNIFPIINCDVDCALGVLRCFYSKVGKFVKVPLVIKATIINLSEEDLLAKISDFPANVLMDNLCSGMWLDIKNCNVSDYDKVIKELQQVTGIKKYRAEFISCPTCGRTSYNLEDIAKKVKHEFAHLKHLKIAVMGCVVNGPGEMSDADYGCVGSKQGMVNIYKRKEVVFTEIPENDAVEKLKEVIINNNDWIEKRTYF